MRCFQLSCNVLCLSFWGIIKLQFLKYTKKRLTQPVNMKTRIQPSRKATKKKPVLEQEPQTNVEPPQEPETDPEVQHSNSQLSITLSVGYNPKEILCRDYEKQVITKFVKNCLTSQGEENSRVLYVSGVPGVGKTISTLEIVKKLKKHISYKKATFIYINAMSLAQPNQIYSAINKQLYKPQKNDIRKNPALGLMLKLQDDNRTKIVIIDEIDFLYTRNQMILYNLFEWSNLKETKFCLIIIANTMDFPEKLQAKLTSRMGNNRLVFKPYSQAEVQKIISDRLMKSNRFSKDAIKYACRKMSSFTSDVRKLLDILKRAIELRPQGVITMEDMTSVWRTCSQQSGQLWQQNLSQFYRTIMNIIKQHGGVSTNYRIHERMCVVQKYKMTQILLALTEMQQMSILKSKSKTKNSLRFLQVTLLKI